MYISACAHVCVCVCVCIEGRALIFLLKIQRIRAQALYVRGGIHEWQPVYGSARYSLETFRVGFSSRVPDHREGRKEGKRKRRERERETETERKGHGRDKGTANGWQRWFPESERDGGGFFCSFPATKWEGPEGESERRVSYTSAVHRPLIWNTYTGGYSASLYSTRMQISSILDFSWMRRSRGWWLVLRGSHFSFSPFAVSFSLSLSSTNAGYRWLLLNRGGTASRPRVSWKRSRRLRGSTLILPLALENELTPCNPVRDRLDCFFFRIWNNAELIAR